VVSKTLFCFYHRRKGTENGALLLVARFPEHGSQNFSKWQSKQAF
jgi:hypothetical protein